MNDSDILGIFNSISTQVNEHGKDLEYLLEKQQKLELRLRKTHIKALTIYRKGVFNV